MLNRCWIDAEMCKRLIAALRNYHRKFNDQLQIFSSKPVHDWSSHPCDAMRVLAVGLEEIDTSNKAPQVLADNNYNPFGKSYEQNI